MPTRLEPLSVSDSEGDITITGVHEFSNGAKLPVIATYYVYKPWDDVYPPYTEWISDDEGNPIRIEQTRGFRKETLRTQYVINHWRV